MAGTNPIILKIYVDLNISFQTMGFQCPPGQGCVSYKWKLGRKKRRAAKWSIVDLGMREEEVLVSGCLNLTWDIVNIATIHKQVAILGVAQGR